MGDELLLVGAAHDRAVLLDEVLADDGEARLREARGHEGRRLQEILDAFQGVQAGHDRDQRAVRGNAQLAAPPAVSPRPEARQRDAVADDADPFPVVAFADQPLLDRLRVDEDGVGQPAGQALDAALGGGEVVADVADRGHDHARSRQPRGRDREDVGIEAVAVHDVDPALAEVAGEAELLAHGLPAVQAIDPILGQGRPGLLDVGEEVAPALEAGEVQIEPRAVQSPGEVDDLALGPPDREHAQELKHPHRIRDGRGRPAGKSGRAHDAPIARESSSAASGARRMPPAATARPAR